MATAEECGIVTRYWPDARQLQCPVPIRWTVSCKGKIIQESWRRSRVALILAEREKVAREIAANASIRKIAA